MEDRLICPHCGEPVKRYRNPFPTVDVIIEMKGNLDETAGGIPERPKRGILLIKRKNPPIGWALPGGFVDYGESLEAAAVREAREETSLDVERLHQLGAYSDPARDPRHHTITVVFVAQAEGEPKAADDAREIGIFDRNSLPEQLVFDHRKILEDYFSQCDSKK
jgi:ADP-ribose pyrophosphatase YjhB (NUDIX family)